MLTIALFRQSHFYRTTLNFPIWTLIAFLVLAIPKPLLAQANPTAVKKADLSAFGLYSRLTPDYGAQKNNGVTFGIDYTRYTRWWVSPSVEFRVKIANGTTVDEKSWGGGIRVEKPINRWHPYADFLVSSGTINYHFTSPPLLPNGKPYVDDATITKSFGAGLDYDVTPRFAFRGDVQFERWYLDKYLAIHLTPYVWSAGVVYRIPFRSFNR